MVKVELGSDIGSRAEAPGAWPSGIEGVGAKEVVFPEVNEESTVFGGERLVPR